MICPRAFFAAVFRNDLNLPLLWKAAVKKVRGQIKKNSKQIKKNSKTNSKKIKKCPRTRPSSHLFLSRPNAPKFSRTVIILFARDWARAAYSALQSGWRFFPAAFSGSAADGFQGPGIIWLSLGVFPLWVTFFVNLSNNFRKNSKIFRKKSPNESPKKGANLLGKSIILSPKLATTFADTTWEMRKTALRFFTKNGR